MARSLIMLALHFSVIASTIAAADDAAKAQPEPGKVYESKWMWADLYTGPLSGLQEVAELNEARWGNFQQVQETIKELTRAANQLAAHRKRPVKLKLREIDTTEILVDKKKFENIAALTAELKRWASEATKPPPVVPGEAAELAAEQKAEQERRAAVAAEIKEAEEEAEKIDTDDDGIISPEEVVQGPNATPEEIKKIEIIYPAADINDDGKVTLDAEQAAKIEEAMSALDADKDGAISLEEATSNKTAEEKHIIEKHYSEADTDDNGALSYEEHYKFEEKKKGEKNPDVKEDEAPKSGGNMAITVTVAAAWVALLVFGHQGKFS